MPRRLRPPRNDGEAKTTARLGIHRQSLLALSGIVALVAAMALGYALTARAFSVEIDGRTLHLRSHLATVGDALREARIWLQPEDSIDPPPGTPLRSGLQVRVQRARTLHISADGETVEHRTVVASVGEALAEAGVRWIPEDRITVGGEPVSGDEALYEAQAAGRRTSSRGGARPAPLSEAPAPLEVAVQRAVPIAVQDGRIPFTFLTAAPTIGEALVEKGIVIYAADKVQPPLDTPVTAGLHAYIDRSLPVTLLADGQIRQTRTRAVTVGDLLQEEGVTLREMDYTRPAAEDPIAPDMRITVVRVRESDVVEQESIPYEEEVRGNPELEIDQHRVENFGSPGIFKRSLKVRYENDIEVSRTLDREWVERPPMNRIVSYGTKIVERQLETPEGTITYWRKLRMRASSYTAATSGKTRDHPEYGITRVGWQARKGIIAVDPRVIPLFTKMYVPRYGQAVAADTGGLILGMHIDLCYPEDAYVHWWNWTDVYLLSPPPPASQIVWTLPNYPTER
ncbi:MAG TPA: ubiquitin-like domain-containing protein [Anaerolineae bacterium]|nr:ubiquitin-like domain-containing protein [Anaerolineae bacterium]HOQ99105.1 ubiquitin-like domain-containing protein [Anaerolineae bacterium]